jgi:hypothetical protein
MKGMLGLMIGVLSLSAVSAFAVDPDVKNESYGNTQLVINGKHIMTFRASADGARPDERWNAAQVRSQRLLRTPSPRPSQVRVVNRRGEGVILIRGRQFITATKADAKANHSTPMALAQLWARNLRQALATIER